MIIMIMYKLDRMLIRFILCWITDDHKIHILHKFYHLNDQMGCLDLPPTPILGDCRL